jgi:N-methylhydantoinase A
MDAPWRIGVDVGGTFTDLVLADATGNMWVFKEPSVPSNPSQGVLNALDAAASTFGLDRAALLVGCSLFIHGSTVATNTILEGKGAKVGLIVTEGFRDSLEIRRGIRFHQWDHRAPYPDVLVPRYLRLPVAGRIDSSGDEVRALDRGALDATLDTLEDEGVESLAIALINSYVNPRHEHAAAEVVSERGGFDWLSVSTEIAPIIGEYERTSTTVLNAYIAPRVVTYLTDLSRALQEGGLKNPLLLVQSNGGVVSIDQMTVRPINLVLSGPAAGIGALNFYAANVGHDLISMEIGGTSCDVMLMNGGHVALTDELIINQYHANIPSVDVHTVGAGGGTIAGVDAAGMLFVGPRGAGARPGPACYGQGGQDPTVTDAHLVLGRLKEGPIGGEGSLRLDEALARRAIEERVARPLGVDLQTAAAGILRLLEQHLLHAVERISTERGYDPQRFTLVAAGGAGPLHGSSVGRMIGCRSVYVPRLAGAFCALGMLHSNLRQDFFQVIYPTSLEGAEETCEEVFRTLERKAALSLKRQGFPDARVSMRRQMDLRYRGQQSSVRVDVHSAVLRSSKIRSDFEEEYRRQFGHIQPGGAIEITTLRVAGIGLLPPLRPATRAPAGQDPRPLEVRDVYLDDKVGRGPTRIYDGRDLAPGHLLPGPLIVRESTTTVFVGPRDRLEVDRSDNFIIHLD